MLASTDHIVVTQDDKQPSAAEHNIAWDSLEHSLSLTEIKRLGWLNTKIRAKLWLGHPDVFVSPVEASRLAFASWLHSSGRLSEWGPRS